MATEIHAEKDHQPHDPRRPEARHQALKPLNQIHQQVLWSVQAPDPRAATFERRQWALPSHSRKLHARNEGVRWAEGRGSGRVCTRSQATGLAVAQIGRRGLFRTRAGEHSPGQYRLPGQVTGCDRRRFGSELVRHQIIRRVKILLRRVGPQARTPGACKGRHTDRPADRSCSSRFAP